MKYLQLKFDPKQKCPPSNARCIVSWDNDYLRKLILHFFKNHDKTTFKLDKVMGEVRRAASVVVVRSQTLCLLERLAHLGPGARAAKSSNTALGLKERRRERQAYDMTHDRLDLHSGLALLRIEVL